MEKNISQAFEDCSGQLNNLPERYKKWRDGRIYNNKLWDFIKDSHLCYKISGENMTFDYLLSLYLWIKPTLVFEYSHKELCIRSFASIVEAVMFDYLSYEIKDESIKKVLFERINADSMRRILYKKKVLSDDLCEYICILFQQRHYIHLHKKYHPVDNAKFNDNPIELAKKLEEFREFMEKAYQYRENLKF